MWYCDICRFFCGITVFVDIFCGITVFGTPQCPLHQVEVQESVDKNAKQFFPPNLTPGVS